MLPREVEASGLCADVDDPARVVRRALLALGGTEGRGVEVEGSRDEALVWRAEGRGGTTEAGAIAGWSGGESPVSL